MSRNARIWLAGIVSCCLLLGAGLVLLPSKVKAVEGGEVRVFLGNPNAVGPLKAPFYKGSRHALLQSLADTSAAIEACVVFNQYETPAAVADLLGDLQIEEVWLADPQSTTGGGTLIEPGESVTAAVSRFVEEHSRAVADLPSEAAGVTRLRAGTWGIVAVKVGAPAARLLRSAATMP